MKLTEMVRLVFSTTLLLTCNIIHSVLASALVIPRDVITYTSNLSYEDYNETLGNSNSTMDEVPSGGNSMSVMWYLVSFGGLVTFFLLLSFSEFCCKHKASPPSTSEAEEDTITIASITTVQPPPYDLFAPPSYESLFRDITGSRKRSYRSSVFLIPVHDKSEIPRESPLEFGEVIRRNPMGDGEVVTPPPPP